MTELQLQPTEELDTYMTPSTKGLQRLRAEVEAMKDAATMARGIAASGFVPDHWIKDKSPDQAVASMASAILFGAELGLSAMRSVNELFVIKGKPAMYSRTMAALVRSAGYVLEPVEETPQRVVWKAYRDGTWKFSEWTMERAEQAGYTSNKLYQTEPISMLRAKCITELCRIAFQDVLLGMDYSIEEINLIDGVQVTRVKRGNKGVAGLREMASEDMSADDAPAVGSNTPVAEPAATGPSREQIKRAVAAANRQGLSLKADILADVSSYMQQQIADWSDVPADDLELYIASLENTREG